jgi:biopolymer transport protein ExbD
MSARLSSDVKAEPNLTPILDMVFQLITFFMLVVNFKSAEIDLTLKLPVVGSARPVETQGHLGVMVMNIDSDGNLKVYGHAVQNIENFILNEAQACMLGNRITSEDLEEGKELPTTIVIRADRATSFKMLNRVIRACQDNGFRSFALKTFMTDKSEQKPAPSGEG